MHQHRQRSVVLVAVLAVLATACSDGDDNLPQGDDTVEEAATDADLDIDASDDADPAPSLTAAPAGSTEFVQDLWIVERLQVVDAEGVAHDRTDDVVAYVRDHDPAPFELDAELTFLAADVLAGAVSGPDGVARDDVDVVAGLLEFEGDAAMAVLATPLDGAEPIGFEDSVSFDVTEVDGIEVGDAVVVEMGFVQGLPSDPAVEDGRGGLELFATRIGAGTIAYFGEGGGAEGPEVLLYTGHLGEVVAGSDRVQIPAKARDMTDGIQKGSRCLSLGLGCVSRFFRSFGSGAQSSFDNALENRNPGNRPPTSPSGGGGGLGPSIPMLPACTVPPCGSTHGEPHLRTLDGTRTTFMAIGEFVLTERDDLTVHARYGPWKDLPGISVTAGVAVSDGDTRLTFQVEDGELVIRIDGEPIDVEELATTLAPVGWEVALVVGRTLQFVTPDAHKLTIYQRNIGIAGTFLSVYLDLAEEDGASVGLLGDGNGDPSDDFVTRDGTQLSPFPVGEELYRVFGDSWRLTDEESLFDYAEGATTATFTDLSFPSSVDTDITDLDGFEPVAVARARTICTFIGIDEGRSLDECVFDVVATGDLAFAEVARTSQLIDQVVDGTLDLDEVSPWLRAGPRAQPELGSLADEVYEVAWDQTLYNLLRQEEAVLEEGETLTVRCGPAEGRLLLEVYGTDVYRDGSPLCAAAVHVGVITQEQGGTFVIEFLRDQPLQDIQPVDRNGIEARPWARVWDAFRVLDD